MMALGTLHNDTYFDRMHASMPDKYRLLDWANPGTLLDIGTGDGGLVVEADRRGLEAVGVDGSDKAIEQARTNTGLEFHKGVMPTRSMTPWTMRRWDNIVFCAVLHEIFSYATGQSGAQRVSRAVQQAAHMLTPGGRILVRDGVGPSDPYTTTRIKFRDPADAARFHARWYELSAHFEDRRPANFTWFAADGCLYGPAWATTAFLTVYVWGRGSVEREAQEFYTWIGSLEAASERLIRWSGLNVLHSEQYTQPGYVEHWEAACTYEQDVDDDGTWVRRDWPYSNAIWILGN